MLYFPNRWQYRVEERSISFLFAFLSLYIWHTRDQNKALKPSWDMSDVHSSHYWTFFDRNAPLEDSHTFQGTYPWRAFSYGGCTTNVCRNHHIYRSSEQWCSLFLYFRNCSTRERASTTTARFVIMKLYLRSDKFVACSTIYSTSVQCSSWQNREIERPLL